MILILLGLFATATAIKEHIVTTNEPLVELPKIYSKDGALEHTLVVEGLKVTLKAEYTLVSDPGRIRKKVHTDEFSFYTRSYNGELPGTTLIVNPGDDLTITLINDLGSQNQVGATNGAEIKLIILVETIFFLLSFLNFLVFWFSDF